MTEIEGIALKRKALEIYFSYLNERQMEAVFTVDGPVLILAGAGSGKTSTIISRIVNMIQFGRGYEKATGDLSPNHEAYLSRYTSGKITKETVDVDFLQEILAIDPIPPENIVAITFTNKAADELIHRLSNALGEETAARVHASTFHKFCLRILHQNIDLLGFQNSFAIYDRNDTKRVIEKIAEEFPALKRSGIDANKILKKIGSAKSAFQSPEQCMNEAQGDYEKMVIAQTYLTYQEWMKQANAVDLDDILYLTVELFQKFPDVLARYQDKFRFVMVDEYQDTNPVQYQLVSLLTAQHKNLCVVGDDDQSIYRFRGATIENILRYEDEYPGCHVYRLEQNYRSTKTILEAANEVIAQNTARKPKHLWTKKGPGERIQQYQAIDARDASRYVVNSIEQAHRSGGKYADNAILYRLKAQSRPVEEAFLRYKIPYRIYGGLRFYDRKEIRDVFAYLNIIQNPNDVIHFERAISAPKRGIGIKTVQMIENIAFDCNLSLLEVMLDAEHFPALSKSASKLKGFAQIWSALTASSENDRLPVFYENLLNWTRYRESMEKEYESTQDGTRLDNLEELGRVIQSYAEDETTETPSLEGFLQETALYTDADSTDERDDVVAMMTIHAAKGMEFDTVYIFGMDEGQFPAPFMCSNAEDMEEERRLAYVAITRAKKHLHIINIRNSSSELKPSRFLRDIPTTLVDAKNSSTLSHRPSATSHRNPQPRQPATQPLYFSVGDRVLHWKFGRGTVISVEQLPSDAMLEVSFDAIGTKTIMAKFSGIKKC